VLSVPGIEHDLMRQRLGELVPRVRDRDPDALEEAYRLTEPMLAAVAFAVLGDHAVAQDVVHDTFLRLIDHAPELQSDDGRSLRAWLVVTARNRARDIVRSGQRRYEDVTADVPDLDDPFVDVAAAALGPYPELQVALGRLTPDQRDALVMFHVVGMDAKEVAEAMDRRRTAVYGLVRRAERSLRIQIATAERERHGASR
jgi:RNA polymerase sigma-70 factor (ECF subfamily)